MLIQEKVIKTALMRLLKEGVRRRIVGKSIYKTGWWSVSFDISLFNETEGKREKEEGVRFEDLSETTQEHIANCIKNGYTQGQIVEDYELDDDDEEGEPVYDEPNEAAGFHRARAG